MKFETVTTLRCPENQISGFVLLLVIRSLWDDIILTPSQSQFIHCFNFC